MDLFYVYLKTKEGLNAVSSVKAIQAVGAYGASLNAVHLFSIGAEGAKRLKMTAHFVHQLGKRFCVASALLMVVKNNVRYFSVSGTCLVMSLQIHPPSIIDYCIAGNILGCHLPTKEIYIYK